MRSRPLPPWLAVTLPILGVASFILIFVMLFLGVRDAPWRMWVAVAAMLICAPIQLYQAYVIYTRYVNKRPGDVAPPAESSDGPSISS